MNIYRALLLIIVSPSEGWKQIKKYNIKDKYIQFNLFYPLLAILFLVSVVSQFIFSVGDTSILKAVFHPLFDVLKYFFTFFITSYIITSYFRFPNIKNDYLIRTNNFILLNMSVLVLINIFQNLLPDFTFFWLLPCYLIYVIVKGISYLEFVNDESKKFIVTLCALLLGLPYGMGVIFKGMLNV